MVFGKKISKIIHVGVIAFLGYVVSSKAAIHVDYASPMGYERWRMTGSPIRCGLSLIIPNYGIGYFEQYATKQPHFILRTWDEVLRAIPASVYAISPVWKPKGPAFLVAETYIKPGEYGIYLPRNPALKLLTYLGQGYQANFIYKSEQGFNIAVTLSPIHFQKVYAKYQRCLGNLLTFDYQEVRESVFYFQPDSAELNEDDKILLRKVAKYIAADGQIVSVRVEGYTDERGRKGYNNAISQYRAEAVKKY